MALSDRLHRLADRAEEADRNAAAARDKAKADLEQDRETSRVVAQQQAEQLRETADAGQDKISAWWKDVQRNWNEHVAQLQEDVETKKTEIDLDRAQKRADNAEADAEFAIDFAYAAIGEADYAALDADLARKEADELAATGASA
jgi:chorismate synthase